MRNVPFQLDTKYTCICDTSIHVFVCIYIRIHIYQHTYPYIPLSSWNRHQVYVKNGIHEHMHLSKIT